MARQHGHPPVTFWGRVHGSWIQNTLASPCGSRWRCHGRVRLVLIFFLLIPFLFKQWWSGSGGPGRSQRVTTPHCSCGTTQTSRAWGAPPTDSVLEPELDTPQSQVKGGWLLLVCHFLDALQTYLHYSDTHRRTDGQMDSVGLHSFAVEIFEIAEVVIGSWLKR